MRTWVPVAMLLLAQPALAGRDRPQPTASQPAAPTLVVVAARADGTPAVRAEVTVDGLERGKTDSEGHFTYTGLRAGQTITLGVSTTGGSPESALVTVHLVGGDQVMPLRLVPEAAPEPAAPRTSGSPVPLPQPASDGLADLDVWVLDERGRPLPGAAVTVNGRGAGETGEEGRVTLADQRPGRRVTVRVGAPMRLDVAVERFTLEEGPQDRTVVLWPQDSDEDDIVDLEDDCPDEPETVNRYADSDGCPDTLTALSVLVLDPDRHPVAGAQVKVGGAVRGHTDDAGRALITGLVPGDRVPVVASVDDPLLAPGGFGAVDILEGDQTLTVPLQRSTRATTSEPVLTVLALDADGRPVPHASVVVDGQLKGRTGTDGAFVYTGRRAGSDLIVGVTAPFRDREVSGLKTVHLDGGPQKVRIWLDGSDGGVGREATADPDGDGRTDTWDECPTEPETVNDYRDEDGCPDALAAVALQVLDTSGEPVEGARVTLDDDEVGVTDARGRVSLPPQVPGVAVRVRVERPGADLRPTEETWSDLGEGSQGRTVRLAILDRDGDGLRDRDDGCVDAGETVNGHDDEDGCPDKLATLFLTVVDGAEGRVPDAEVRVAGEVVGRTDADGWAEIPDLAPGKGLVVAVEAGGAASELSVDLVEGAQRYRIVLETAISGGRAE